MCFGIGKRKEEKNNLQEKLGPNVPVNPPKYLYFTDAHTSYFLDGNYLVKRPGETPWKANDTDEHGNRQLQFALQHNRIWFWGKPKAVYRGNGPDEEMVKFTRYIGWTHVGPVPVIPHMRYRTYGSLAHTFERRSIEQATDRNQS